VKVDFGKTAGDYGQYRAGFPGEFFDRLFSIGYVRSGQAVLDLGTGTGTVARDLALRGCRVVGLDPAQELLDEATRLDSEARAGVRYIKATAENTGLPSQAFDVVTAAQCWHWFDRPRAAAEARRVLRPRGRIIIAHRDWLPLPGNVVEATERLIMKHNPEWKLGGGTGVYPTTLTDLSVSGFSDIETFSFDAPVPYSHEAWLGRIRASAGVAASLSEDAVRHFDDDLADVLAANFPQEPLLIPHRNWTATAISNDQH